MIGYLFFISGERHEVRCGTYTIGRHSTCDICIRDMTVSRQHCRLIVKEDCVLVPLKKTYINGKEINTPKRMKHGDVVTLGTQHFRYEAITSPQSTSSSISPMSDDCQIINIE